MTTSVPNKDFTFRPCAEMYLFGIIGEDIKCEDFVRELKELAANNTTIVIHINSGGGSVFDGLAIYNALKNCPAKTIGKIDGLCASMSSIVCLGMNAVYMSKVAQIMTHKPSSFISGTSDDLRSYASLIENMENTISGIYGTKTGLTNEQAKETFMQDRDTWFSPEEALSIKLIDGIFDNESSGIITIPSSAKGNQQSLLAYYTKHILTAKSWDQLDKEGLLPQLKTMDLAAFKAKFEARFGVPYKGISAATRPDQKETMPSKFESLRYLNSKSWVELDKEGLLPQLKKLDLATFKAKFKAHFGAPYKEPSTQTKAAQKDVMPSKSKSLEYLNSKSWVELDKEGLLLQLKELDLTAFKAKFNARFGVPYKEPSAPTKNV